MDEDDIAATINVMITDTFEMYFEQYLPSVHGAFSGSIDAF